MHLSAAGNIGPSRWAASWGSEGGTCQAWHPCQLRPFFSGSFSCQSRGSHCQLMVGLAGVVLWRFLWLPANYRRSFWNQAVHSHSACLSRYLSFPPFASFSATTCLIRLISFISFIQKQFIIWLATEKHYSCFTGRRPRFSHALWTPTPVRWHLTSARTESTTNHVLTNMVMK